MNARPCRPRWTLPGRPTPQRPRATEWKRRAMKLTARRWRRSDTLHQQRSHQENERTRHGVLLNQLFKKLRLPLSVLPIMPERRMITPRPRK